ncbi:hypothetical protein IQ249_14155 [Lusitaniella coriacea LEGE 07157]|uniref:DUF6737 domain-containing protein n=1 Tax=Lusitaniella coriacea LEGE 07157 TaxID=945747 RepID=A0A8J7JBL2_9CYAN|nr:DUF6737 family protein [Lusitaniella coriacea]MBE9117040.1 hypothetical protein [Lusitaniella coriacea LEGE 07157]
MSSDKSLNPWHYKPWWCQPWSIVLTGILLVVGSGFLSNRLWVAAIVALPILMWWGYFLILWPRLMQSSGILSEYHRELRD